MKKIISCCIAFLFIFTLSACNLDLGSLLDKTTDTAAGTVNMDLNGGSGRLSISFVDDTCYASDLPTPTKAGDVFAGWYLDAKCKNPVGDKLINIQPGLVLYAGWEVAMKTAAFEVDSIPRIDISTLNNQKVESKYEYVTGKFSSRILPIQKIISIMPA